MKLRIVIMLWAICMAGGASAASKKVDKPSLPKEAGEGMIVHEGGENPIIFALAKVVIRPKADPSQDQEDRELNYSAEMQSGTDVFPEGMMIEKELKEDEAVVFSYPESRVAKLNLKNLLISRDILFVNERGDITEIIRRVPARSSQPVYSVEPVKYVIQLTAGAVKKYNIKIGDKAEIATVQ